MKTKVAVVFVVIALVCGSGCSSLASRTFDSNSNWVYDGIRQDGHDIVHPKYWYGPFVNIVDFPFSFVADTLFLPSDLRHSKELRPVEDPLKGWASWSPGDEESQPAGSHNDTTPPPGHAPLDRAITADYNNFIKQREFGRGPEVKEFVAWGGSITFFEDGTGRHAVKVVVPCENLRDLMTYILIYDQSDVRVKVISYKWYKPFSGFG
jgi:uncharacterized protein YceK